MAIRYPRKQTVIISVVCIGVVGLTMYYTRADTDTSQARNIQGFASSSSFASGSPAIPANNDWKKQFFDASSSSYAFKSVPKNASSSMQDEHLTATDQLARDFFTKYMELQQAGLTTNSDVVSSTVDDLINTSAANARLPKPFTISDIHTIPTTDNSILTNYGQAIKKILGTYTPTPDQNEAVIAENALEKDDMSLLNAIDPVISSYQTEIKALSSMNVPQPLAQYHLDLLNGVNLALFNARSLRHIDTDPVSGVNAINLEMTALTAMSDAVGNITQYLSNNGVNVTI